MKLKRLVALVLVASCAFTGTAFAKTETKTKTVYTYEQILKKVMDNNSDLSLLEQNLEIMDLKSTSLVQSLGGMLYPQSDGFLVLENYVALAQLNQLSVTKQTVKYKREELKQKAEYSVMNALASINASEDALALADANFQVFKQKYNMILLQNRLGMVSENEVISAKTTMQEYEIDVEKTKIELASTYSELARLMGVTNKDFAIEFALEYETLKLVGSLDENIEKMIKTNPVLVSTRYNADSLSNNKNIMIANRTEIYAWEEIEYQIAEVEAGVRTSENGFRHAGELLYKSLITMEGNIDTLEANLVIAKKNLAATEEKYNQGKATKIQLDDAKIIVGNLENSIDVLKTSYMITVFGFKNPHVTMSIR